MQLEMKDLGRLYRGKVWGLRRFSLKLDQGVLGLVGPNGAGKSTLMRILATVTKPTEGKVLWNGADIIRSPDILRPVLGYLPQDFGVYPNLNAVEFLEYLAVVKGLDIRTARLRIDELVQAMGLVDVSRRPLGSYSGGMKQRVGIAQALLNDPQLLIVDEPTAGLDPEERVHFRNLLSDLAGERIVILSTHIVPDVEAVATDVAILNQGGLLRHSVPEDLLSTVEGKTWECVIPSADLTVARQQYILSSAVRRSDGVHARAISDSPPDFDARPVSPTLEDAYLYWLSNPNGKGKK